MKIVATISATTSHVLTMVKNISPVNMQANVVRVGAAGPAAEMLLYDSDNTADRCVTGPQLEPQKQ